MNKSFKDLEIGLMFRTFTRRIGIVFVNYRHEENQSLAAAQPTDFENRMLHLVEQADNGRIQDKLGVAS